MSHVKIGPSFFKNALADYSDPIFAYAREATQNGIDARGSTRMDVVVARDGENTRVCYSNNGEPMTEDVLLHKFFAIGESGKRAGETVGGFGRARELLVYAQLRYEIVTGDWIVRGCGGDYTIERNPTHYHGTQTIVWMDGDRVEDLVMAWKRFAMYAQWSGTLTVNGVVLATDLKKGSRRRDLGWGVVYTNRSYQSVCVIRIGGQPMFIQPCSFSGCVVIELSGNSGDVLTSNRDSLKYAYGSQLGEFLTSLAVDKRSALREQKAAYKRFQGEKLRNAAKQPHKVANMESLCGISVAMLGGTITFDPGEGFQGRHSAGGICVTTAAAEESVVTLGPEFILKNTTGMDTPAYYVPGPQFSAYAKGLVRTWAAVLVKLHQLLDHTAEFSVGFVLDEENGAEWESGMYGVVYYLNPARVVRQASGSQSRSFQKRFKGAWADRFEILALACHEIVHGMGFRGHSEDYASKLTDVMAVAFKHQREFTVCFK